MSIRIAVLRALTMALRITGSDRAAKMPMIVITTKTSTRVKPAWERVAPEPVDRACEWKRFITACPSNGNSGLSDGRRCPLAKSLGKAAEACVPSAVACVAPPIHFGGLWRLLSPQAREAAFSLAWLATQAGDQTDQRHEQTDHDKADRQPEEHDHDRLHHRQQTIGQRADFFVVSIGHLVQHRVQLARLLPDVDHI